MAGWDLSPLGATAPVAPKCVRALAAGEHLAIGYVCAHHYFARLRDEEALGDARDGIGA